MKWVLVVLIFPAMTFGKYRFPNIIQVGHYGQDHFSYGKFKEIKIGDWKILEDCSLFQYGRIAKYIGDENPSFYFENKLFELNKNGFHGIFFETEEACKSMDLGSVTTILMDYFYYDLNLEFKIGTKYEFLSLSILTQSSHTQRILTWYEDSPEEER